MKRLFGFFMVTALLQLPELKAQSFDVFFPKSNTDIGFGTKSVIDTSTPRLKLIVNGPLHDSYELPVGGYVDQGKLMKPWLDANMAAHIGGETNFTTLNGVFGQDGKGNMVLFPYDVWRDMHESKSPKLRWGFQNGPMLILNGKNLMNPNSTSKFVRSAIGFREDETLVVVVSQVPVTFWELAYRLERAGCTDAIYLSGGDDVGYATKHGSWGLDSTGMKLQFYE